jgi:hypothetical protein
VAPVLTFPAQPVEPQALGVPMPDAALAPNRPYTLVELLEQRGGLDWRECVTLAHLLCQQLKKQASSSPIVVDPRNIQITGSGDVRLLPSPTGGDPLVMQVGRLLRTMLMGRPAPPELRLLMAQATFELPIFETIEEVDRALLQMERLEENRAANGAPNITKFVPPPFEATDAKIAESVRPIRPVTARPRRAAPNRLPPVGAMLSTASARIVAGLVIVAAVLGLFVAWPTTLLPHEPVERRAAGPAFKPPVAPPTDVEAPAASTTAPVSHAPQPTTGTTPVAVPSREAANRPPAPVDHPRTRSNNAERAPRSAAPAAIVPPPRESERRATALVAQGQTAEAAQLFSTMLSANPLYEPKSSDLTPESLSAFRATQKQLLPVLAQRSFDRAKAALGDGDVERALSAGREAAAILEKPAAEPAVALRQPVQQLLDDAIAAKANADEIVYTRADAGVVPPRPLSRQFPATTPFGVPPHRVGTLEMVIAKDGTVEFVKLHTPLNRYHERMIVSAAKAWLYRPAMRAGKPVKFRLTVTINLPENGTY